MLITLLPCFFRIYTDSDCLWADSTNDTDVSYHATLAYYDVQSQLRRLYPHLLLEICNDGGRMVDFGSAAHGDYFSISDAYDPLSNRRAFYDASYVLPPAMLEGIHWDGIEYFDPARGKGALFAFHGSSTQEPSLRGLNPEQRYRLPFHDHPAQSRMASGSELMKERLRVVLPTVNSSELVFLSAASR